MVSIGCHIRTPNLLLQHVLLLAVRPPLNVVEHELIIGIKFSVNKGQFGLLRVSDFNLPFPENGRGGPHDATWGF